MASPLRLSVYCLLGLLGLAGLVSLPPNPPLASRTGAGTGEILGDLEAQEALLEQRQQAAVLLNRFVGAEITRYFWGGFSGYLDVLGIEVPSGMKADLTLKDETVQLVLAPRLGKESYVGRVEAIESVPRAAVCRGSGPVPGFPLRRGRLECPRGWHTLDNIQAPRVNR
jgi:hypothetical protein